MNTTKNFIVTDYLSAWKSKRMTKYHENSIREKKNANKFQKQKQVNNFRVFAIFLLAFSYNENYSV